VKHPQKHLSSVFDFVFRQAAERAGIEPATNGFIRLLLVLKTSWATRPVLSMPRCRIASIIISIYYKQNARQFQLKCISNSNFATEGTENTGENCRGLIYQALPTSNSPIGFDESNPYDRIYLTKVGHFRNRQNQN
jgi:hypothetical protein